MIRSVKTLTSQLPLAVDFKRTLPLFCRGVSTTSPKEFKATMPTNFEPTKSLEMAPTPLYIGHHAIPDEESLMSSLGMTYPTEEE